MKFKKTMTGVMITAVMLATTVGAATLHVGVGQEYETITNAYANVAAGDTIEIHEGTYTEFPYLGSATTADFRPNNVTFQRHGNDKVVIELAGRIYFRRRTGNKFIGLIFNGQGVAGQCFDIRSAANNTEFRDCIFINPGNTGIYVYGGTTYPVSGLKIINCTFYNCGMGFHQRDTRVTETMVSNSLFVDNTTAIQFDWTIEVNPTYSAFYGNNAVIGFNTISWEEGYVLGEGCVSNAVPIFASTDIASPDFMYLNYNCPVAITEGGSEGQVIGARPALQDKATRILIY